MLITCTGNDVLQSLSDCIVGSTGVFQYIEEDYCLLILCETSDGFEWASVDQCVRLGAPENGKLVCIKNNPA